MYKNLILSVDELWLKGKNRPSYFRALLNHIHVVVKSYTSSKYEIKNVSQRLFLSFDNAVDDELVLAITKIPGLSQISPSILVERNKDEKAVLSNLYRSIIEELRKFDNGDLSFRATVKRVDKRFNVSSMDLEREIGHQILISIEGSKVKLKRPEINIDVRVVAQYISISIKKYSGIGGLPFGTSGTGLCLLSGGFDSPVASYLMNKRGLKQSFVFFHAYPYVGHEVIKKIKELVRVLSSYKRQTHLYIIPFGDIQNAIREACSEEYRTIFFRKLMVRTSNQLADKIGAEVLITGDSLGQVSSQTLVNISLIDKDSKLSIFRPLIGMNKQEVLNIASKIGTHDISIIPHDDACALFAPESPIIFADKEYWNQFSQDFNCDELIAKAIDNAEIYSVNSRGDFFKKEYFSYDS